MSEVIHRQRVDRLFDRARLSIAHQVTTKKETRATWARVLLQGVSRVLIQQQRRA